MESRRKRTRVRRHFVTVFAAAFLFSAAQSHAFKQTYHESMTEAELGAMGFDEDSADEVGDASYNTDYTDFFDPAAHVDNNMLDAGSERLRLKKTAVVEALKSCQRKDALKELGKGLHTVQDVFAHSNAVDNGIGVSLLNMTHGVAWCAPPGFAPGGLVSGFFTLGLDDCSEARPGECCHRDLNKDSPTVPNGGRFALAYDVAGQYTRDYVQLVLDDLAAVGGDQAVRLEKMLKENQRTLSFVIDDTGSMYDDIAGVRSAALGVLDASVAAGEAPTLGLVTFKDSVSDFGESCDIETFRSQINGLYASGGGDCPEASNSALLTSLGNFPLISTDARMRGGRILLATDASAGDYALGPLVAMQAVIRGVSVDAILTGDCYAEESAPGMAVASSLFSPSDNNPKAVKSMAASPAVRPMAGDPLSSYSARTQLKALTAQTGGVLFNVARVEVDDVVPTLLELGAPDTAVIRAWRVRSAAGAIGEVDIPVDETLAGQVNFMVTASTAAALPAFTVLDPAGNVVTAATPGVTRLLLSSVDKYAISAPATGTWRLRFDNPGDFVVRAFGRSSLQTDDLMLFDPAIPPVTSEIELMPVEGQPMVGRELVVEVGTTTAAATIETLVLRRDDGTLLGTVTPALVAPRHYRASLVPPAEPFLIEIAGQSVGGAPFLRQTAVPVQPQSVGMRVNPKGMKAAVGTVADMAVTVSNASAAEATYSLTATADAAWTVELPATVTVAAGSSADVTLRVTVPPTASEGAVVNVVLLAQDTANSLVRNTASASVSAIVNRAPDCSAATASVPVLLPPRPGHHLGQEQGPACDYPKARLVKESILGVVDPDGDVVGITITGITQDEPVRSRHDRTSPDGSGVGTAEAAVRNERDEHRDGRVYAIYFDANDGRGAMCSGVVNVSVPRDRKHPAVDSGQRYDSTVR